MPATIRFLHRTRPPFANNTARLRTASRTNAALLRHATVPVRQGQALDLMSRHPLTWLDVFFPSLCRGFARHICNCTSPCPHNSLSKKKEDGYAREHTVKVEMEIHKIFDSVLALVVRISERVVEQIVDGFVRQSMDESVEVVKRTWQERTQRRTARRDGGSAPPAD